MNDNDMARSAIQQARIAAMRAEQILKRLPDSAAGHWAVAKFVAWQVDCLCMLEALGLAEANTAGANETAG